MKELALHILDIAENSLRAGASRIDIEIVEDPAEDTVRVAITDDGRGMDEETLKKALDPFFTTKDVRKVGMGLSLLRQAARRTGGDLRVQSRPGEGTAVTAEFVRSHIDRQPLGDMASTITAVLLQNPAIELRYHHAIGADGFTFDTSQVRSVLDGVPLSDPEVLQFIGNLIRERQQLT
ncbi:ATP-binding protein [Candidatus Fermentibacteria bacterium]|nr:ATP-binding protein [Candidatus Fermentibacteria bacterium]